MAKQEIQVQQAKALVKLQRVSARKARLVADLFRGKDVRVALGILQNTAKKAAPLFVKLLNSAVANATNNHGMDASKLFVKEVLVNEGPTLKRFQPRSQGRAYSIFKRTSHLSITLEERN
ncbi:50S ribosomal protein L22 [Mycoplasmopsis alligatoris]|uniref:Large ribosomal subunit protein uL22 n=1 Tax=Mycoplasmopsis alligatoris A21JP2 TaxID=747682 RepID=D4XVJ0_9BACT|nr:50S ribosomal protein L22 [Mycoplasmopsis alligatoris]EFF41668.1 ribosomal protein L22 [Mycoplasmopsis alligatoris A21JP2]